jgi:Cys-tRNA(Pro)/Cys-tRNA(Cys) deacylase
LEQLGVRFELREDPVDPDDLAAERVAEKIGLPAAAVFKTLLARGDRTGPLFAVVPADRELDLKALAKASRNRSAALVPLKEVQPLTGYIRGGVTALGSKKVLPVFLDASAHEHATISVSAGIRGTQILLAPGDYARATGATVADLGRRAASRDP